jgi:predicted nucleic-acid-binding protein
MRAIDTNVLVRIVVEDDASQVESATNFIKSGAWVSTLALAEAIWVLEDVYGLTAARLADAIEMVLAHRDLIFQDAEAAASALVLFRQRPSLGFSNCLLSALAQKTGHLPLGTFDRALSRAPGAQLL